MNNNNSESTRYKGLLKLNVEQKFGKEVEYSQDCKLLSSQIYAATGRQLSVSTIKRFFELIHSPFNPSKFTLDTFAGYLGMENWERFIEANKNETTEDQGMENADLLNESLESITKTSCVSLSRKVRYKPDTFIHRTFADTFFEGFMKSEKTATMLIAPAGYGKSALLLQWMKTFFSGNDSRFKDDVVCLIDGGIFFTFYSQAHQNELLTQLLDFDFKTIRNLYEKQKLITQKVRYVLIIDDVDRVFSVQEKSYQFTENIMRLIMLNKGNPWFKVILTCRPENLDAYTSLVTNNPLLADAFYKIKFFHKNRHDIVNIPLFSNDEIKKAFGKYNRNFSYYRLSLYHPDVFKIINTPRFFSFFIHDDNSSLEEFSEIDFLNRLIQHFYCSQPFAEEKQELVNNFIHLSNINSNFTFLRKDLLLEKVECRLAYNDLVKNGLLYEYLGASNQPGVQLNVRFSNSEVYEYLFAWKLVREKGLNLALINFLLDNYRDIIHLQYALLRWIVKIAFFEENSSFLKQLHQSMERQVDFSRESGKESIPGALQTIQAAFVECFRTNSKMGEGLLPEFAKAGLGQKLFFEEYFDLDNLMHFPEKGLLSYVQNNKTTDGEMIFHFVRFIKGFYSQDFMACSMEYKIISRINYDELKSPLSIGYYFSTWFLYACLNNYQKRDDMLKKFLAASEKVRKKGVPSLRYNPGFEFYVLYHLNTCDFFEDYRFVEEYLKGLKYSDENQSSVFFQFYKLCYARSLFHTGEQEKALELYHQVKFNNFPFYMKHFMRLNVNLAKFDFLEFENKAAEALTLLQETRLLAKQMGYKYFVQKAEELEFKLLNAKNDSPS